ncbi:glycosyltransferase family 4 protein [Chitinophaga arvensicola]|uniref:Glycosyltransferase involved in cell wall bisynthesis n=1 Tax=Chitinophaga arvensicola TaxID=29529 RepID=A0A1I0S8Z0_9BACT|nr:glycosyltransferase family 4 protein [Chitinophaga arvensicola]SEW52472.1 Glycosyltransferase involved in cell wall bisynthesis [Chitinophaga arvensicola]
MRILYIHQYFTLPAAAGGTRSYDLSKRFTQAGHKVIVITSSSFLKNLYQFSKGWTILELEGIELHVLHVEYSNKMSFSKRIIAFLKFLVFASFRTFRIKADVVLATSTPITVAIPAITAKFFKRVPFIFEVRDVWPEVPVAMGIIKNKMLIRLLERFEKYIYAKSAHIVALSDDMKSSVIRRIGLPAHKLSVIANISETDRFSKYSQPGALLPSLLGYAPRKVVLYAGTLGMVNGLKYMVQLASHVHKLDPSVKFIIFGDGMEKEMLVQYAQSEGILNQNIYFFDPVPKSQLSQLYYECTVASSFVTPIPQLWANSANKFFDCLAAARPVVINHQGWQAAVIEQENVGFVLDFDIKKMAIEAQRFCNYINDDLLLETQRNRAGRLAKSAYSLDIAASNYLKILSDVVS